MPRSSPRVFLFIAFFFFKVNLFLEELGINPGYLLGKGSTVDYIPSPDFLVGSKWVDLSIQSVCIIFMQEFDTLKLILVRTYCQLLRFSLFLFVVEWLLVMKFDSIVTCIFYTNEFYILVCFRGLICSLH
jgi:hypothetical protein